MNTAKHLGVDRDEEFLDPNTMPIRQLSDLKSLMAHKIEYISNTRFRRPTMMQEILQSKIVDAHGGLLNADQEQILFLRMNYSLYRLNRLRGALRDSTPWRSDNLAECLEWNRLYLESRDTLVSANLGLVLTLAKRMSGSGPEYSDRVSEGNLALLRAVHRYDCSLGNRFSTYGYRVILLSLIQLAHRWHRHHRIVSCPWDISMETDSVPQSNPESHPSVQIQEILAMMNRPNGILTNLERQVIEARFCLGCIRPKPRTLRQVGDQFGLSTGRVRRVLNQGLTKLRIAAQRPMSCPLSLSETVSRLG